MNQVQPPSEGGRPFQSSDSTKPSGCKTESTSCEKLHRRRPKLINLPLMKRVPISFSLLFIEHNSSHVETQLFVYWCNGLLYETDLKLDLNSSQNSLLLTSDSGSCSEFHRTRIVSSTVCQRLISIWFGFSAHGGDLRAPGPDQEGDVTIYDNVDMWIWTF